jgi:hypothetical protein
MKLEIVINCNTEAFNGADCGSEIARILRPLPDRFEFESKSAIVRRYRTHPKRLRDKNGETVGKLAIVIEERGPS